MSGTRILAKLFMSVTRCDIFCKVIDNFGDIGVCWRLSRQLAAEHGLAVRLWVDDLACFQHLAPDIDAAQCEQTLAGVRVRRWDDSTANAEPADIVIEAFACDPPETYIAAMAARAQKPAWINLEYLTAESWAADSHGLASPHPRLPLTKYFFFPGFTPATGGLIREAALTDDLQAFRLNKSAQQSFWLSLLGEPLPEPVLKLSLFAYENAALPDLLDAWASGEREIFCAVTAGRHVPQVQTWLQSVGAAIGRESTFRGQWPLQQIGRLTLAFLPWLSQPDYDHLLAACDLNFVRGEDSFIRAQWASRPFVWHIYQQEAGAHLAKLAAFLDQYASGLDVTENAALRDFWQAWEDEENADAHWPALLTALPALQAHATEWTQNLVTQGDLASKLLIFCQNLLECAAFPKAVAGPPPD